MVLSGQRVLYSLVGLWVEEQLCSFSYRVSAHLLEAFVRFYILFDVKDSHTMVYSFLHSLDTRPLHRGLEHLPGLGRQVG